MPSYVKIILLALLFLLQMAKSADAAKLVSSIAPLYSIVSYIAGDTAENNLLVQNNNSEHGYMLKPSQIMSINQADLVFYIDNSLESFIAKIAQNNKEKFIAIAKIKDLKILPIRGQLQDGKHVHYHNGNFDPHIWLDSNNAKIIAKFIAQNLQEKYPQNKNLYAQNLHNFNQELDKTVLKIKVDLAKIPSKNYISFHDAYQYFEQEFDLNNVGFITLNVEMPTSAKQLSILQDNIKKFGVKCLFAEPQFDGSIVKKISDKNHMFLGTIDPLGSNIKLDKQLYFKLLQNIASAFGKCV